MSLSSLSAHLTQALPAPLQHKLGGQNAPDNMPPGLSNGMPFPSQKNAQSPEQGQDSPNESLHSRLTQTLSRSKQRLQQLWPGYAASQQTQTSGIFTNADAQAAAEAGQEPAAKSLGSSLESSLGHRLGNKLENILGHKLENPLENRLETQAGVQGGAKVSKLWHTFKQKLHLERPSNGQKPEQPGKPQESPQNGTPTEPKPSEQPTTPQNPQAPGQAGQKPPLKRMEALPEWKPGDPPVKSGPWAKKIELLNWDQLVEQRLKGYYTKTPKYSLTPDQIRVNYPRKQQECLEKLVYSMKWNDDDAINPFSEKLPTER